MVANPVAGLQGVPPRIKLEAKSLTVKTGVIGGSTTLLYSNIAEVRFNMLSSLTLSGTLIIVPYRGADIKLMGFYKKQYLQVKQAVENGYFADDGGSDDSSEVPTRTRMSGIMTAPMANLSSSPQPKTAEEIRAEAEAKEMREKREAEERRQEQERKDNAINEIHSLVETQDEKKMLDNLNKLATLVQTSKDEVKKAAKTNFETQLSYLKSVSPANPMIPMYEDRLKKINHKIGGGCLKTALIIGGIGLVLIILLLVLFG